ncbi:MAG: GNAT family N-acetyltransferase [Pseudomonadota bacterium]
METVYAHHPNAGWVIRPLMQGDVGQALGVFETCLAEFPWRESFAKERAHLFQSAVNSDVLIASEAQAGVVGFMVADLSTGYVSHLFVDLDWRLCGIGSAFLALAREASGQPLVLDVDEGNSGGRAAYESLGWRIAEPARMTGRGYRQVRMISP